MGTSNSQLISDSLIGYITSERLDLVEGLLNSFKDPSQICNMRNNKSGSTPIMVAIFIGNVNIVSYLLTYDIDLCAKDIRDNSVLHYLIASPSGDKYRLAQVLAKSKSFTSLTEETRMIWLHELVQSSQEDLVRALLDEGVNRNMTDANGISALHRAVDAGDANMVKLLIRKDCQLNQADASGWTALHVAVIHNDIEIVQILLAKGANVNLKDAYSLSPLAYARHNNAKLVVNFLRKSGAREPHENGKKY